MSKLIIRGVLFMTPLQQANKQTAEYIIKNLEKRNMQGFYCENKAEALAKALDIIEKGSKINWGGTMTVDEIGLSEAIKNGDYKLFDRSLAKTPEEVRDVALQAFDADYFLMSTNAITYEGELVNIDGMGNRVAALIYGPKNVLVIAGMNKVTSDIDSAIKRVHEKACPPNAIRVGAQTPCSKTGICHDCLGGTICCQTVITRFSRIKDRIKVILVGEELGY